ncbi:cystathionine beta-lyase [Altererythrobacter confluentis]|uniref:Cystathionine beta-lyase n=1 Tax=Allopontixanthobacter confluentis TaxID=1849021 RepID=A0A6L7GE88_9SPHN|nr:cystathionine beta-lyase [Allopontixanthobacter confluentis]MXP13504.1 cystathionine beta-lyase [Allopontixanthobacter confluentis]
MGKGKFPTDHPLGQGTRLAIAGRDPEYTGAVVNPPVWRASTHLYADTAALKDGTRHNEDGRFFYGRRGAPTQWALSDALTALEPGAEGTVLYPSGVAAIAGALMAVLSPGDVLLVTDNAYEPTRNMATGLLKRFGVQTRFVDPLDGAAFEASICSATKAVLLESPGSLTMEVQDIPALTAIARQHGVISIIDNTWATPLGFPALERGCDIAIMSLTKHVGGHSDLMMGSAAARGDLYRTLRQTAQALGHVVSPDDASLALRSLRTMGLRLDRSTHSALAIASWLKGRAEVAHVLCPLLPGAPGHELWTRDFTGGCGLFSFVIKGRSAAARSQLIDALQLFGIGYSWGGYESLAIPFDPAGNRSATPWPPSGWDTGDRYGIRLSIGLEDPADLICDLATGFAAMEQADMEQE